MKNDRDDCQELSRRGDGPERRRHRWPVDRQGKPQYFAWSGAEKTYADFELTGHLCGGGHSSRHVCTRTPSTQMSPAVYVRIGEYKFKPELSDLTRAYFKAAASYETSQVAAAMRAFAADGFESDSA